MPLAKLQQKHQKRPYSGAKEQKQKFPRNTLYHMIVDLYEMPYVL